MNIAIAVFVKTPGLSPVKTRLESDLGEQETVKFYLQCIKTTKTKCLALVKKYGVSFYWAVAEDLARDHSLWRDRDVLIQSSGGLGERLASIANQIQDRNYDGFFFMGADCPHFDFDQVSLALSYLDSSEDRVVIGPCFDGGYYFLGSNRFFDQDFWVNVRYSCKNTYADVVRNCSYLKLAMKAYKKDFDIDNFKEYQRFKKMEKL